MAIYTTNELAFEVPDEAFEVRTLNELDAPLPEDGFLSVLIRRTPIPPESGLDEAVRAHVSLEARRLSFHEVIEALERPIGGTRGIEILSSWAHGRRRVYTREAHVAVAGVRVTFSATTPLEHREACDAYFQHMIETLALSDRAGSP
jgi:hypothetical protein